MKVERVDTWAAAIADQPGGLAEKLAALRAAGCNLTFVMARRAPDEPGTGVVFVTPIKGNTQCRAARKTGFRKTASLHALRVEGLDRKGLGAQITEALAAKGINLRGISASSLGRKFVAVLAFDSSSDATRAARSLRAM